MRGFAPAAGRRLAGFVRRMGRTSHILMLVAGGLGIAIVAGIVGFRAGARAQASAVAVSDIFVSAQQGVLADFERTNGTDADYEAALRRYIALLEELEARRPPESSASTYSMDKAFSLIRLAGVLRKKGETAGAEKLALEGSSVCAKVSSRDCSVGALTDLVAKLDKRSL
jgi:hypothetical protein